LLACVCIWLVNTEMKLWLPFPHFACCSQDWFYRFDILETILMSSCNLASLLCVIFSNMKRILYNFLKYFFFLFFVIDYVVLWRVITFTQPESYTTRRKNDFYSSDNGNSYFLLYIRQFTLCQSTMLWRQTRGLNNTYEICSECLMEMMMISPLQKSQDLQHVVCICSLVLCATMELDFVPQGCTIFMICIHIYIESNFW
jgi:hypothetical protein